VAGGAAGETLDDTTERELQDEVAELEFEDALLDFGLNALNLPEDVILDIDHMRLVVMILQMKETLEKGLKRRRRKMRSWMT